MDFSLEVVTTTANVQTGPLVAATWQPGNRKSSPLLCGFLYLNGTFRLWNAVTNEHWTFCVKLSNRSHAHWRKMRILTPATSSDQLVTVVFLGEDPHKVFTAVINLDRLVGSDESPPGHNAAHNSGIQTLATPSHKSYITCLDSNNLGANEFLTACADGTVCVWSVRGTTFGKSQVIRHDLQLRRRFSAATRDGPGSPLSKVEAVAACGSTIVAFTSGLRMCVFHDPDARYGLQKIESSGSIHESASRNGYGWDDSSQDETASSARTELRAMSSGNTSSPRVVDLASLLPARKKSQGLAVRDAAAFRDHSLCSSDHGENDCTSADGDVSDGEDKGGVCVVLGTDDGICMTVPLRSPASYRMLSFPGQALECIDVVGAARDNKQHPSPLAVVACPTGGWLRLCRLGSEAIEVVGFVEMDKVKHCEFRPMVVDSLHEDQAPATAATTIGKNASLLAASENGGIRVWAPDKLPLCEDDDDNALPQVVPSSPARRLPPATGTPRSADVVDIATTGNNGDGPVRGRGTGHFPRTEYKSRDKMDAMANICEKLDGDSRTESKASSLAVPTVQSQRLVAASLAALDQRVENLPEAAAHVDLDPAVEAAVRRAAANEVVNYAPHRNRYRGLVPLDAPAESAQNRGRPKLSDTCEGDGLTAASRVAQAMADAMADDEDDMADTSGGSENAACDALALQFLKDYDDDCEMAQIEAEGAMAMMFASSTAFPSSAATPL